MVLKYDPSQEGVVGNAVDAVDPAGDTRKFIVQAVEIVDSSGASASTAGAGGGATAVTAVGSLAQGRATDAAPTYADSTRQPLSLDATGNLRAVTPYSRKKVLTTTFTPSASYATQFASVGGLFTVAAGVGNNAPVLAERLSVNFVAASVGVVPALSAYFFQGAPAMSIANGAIPTWTAADAAALRQSLTLGASSPTGTTFAQAFGQLAPGSYLTTDGSGNLYFYISVSTNTFALTTPGVATIAIQIGY